jgi:hypothetical protein
MDLSYDEAAVESPKLKGEANAALANGFALQIVRIIRNY